MATRVPSGNPTMPMMVATYTHWYQRASGSAIVRVRATISGTTAMYAP